MSDIEDIIFKDPPPTTRGGRKTDWQSIADQLRQRPGEWALIKRNDTSNGNTSCINRGLIVAFRPAGAFEATWRQTSIANPAKPLGDLYVRYVGVKDET